MATPLPNLQQTTSPPAAPRPRPIPRLRWWIGGMLFAMTVINYIDRQTINVLAPILKKEHQWTNSDFAWILISFRVGYTIMQSINGRLLDRFGTRLGLSISVTFYSAVQMMTTLAKGWVGFAVFVFCWRAERRPTTPAPPRRYPNGFRPGNAPGQWRYSTAAVASAPRWRHSWCCSSINGSAIGGQCSC